MYICIHTHIYIHIIYVICGVFVCVRCHWGTRSSISLGSFSVETGATRGWDCAWILEMKSPVWTTLYTAASPKSRISQRFIGRCHAPVNPSGIWRICGIFNKAILPLHCKVSHKVFQSLHLHGDLCVIYTFWWDTVRKHPKWMGTQFHRAQGAMPRHPVAKRPQLSSSSKKQVQACEAAMYLEWFGHGWWDEITFNTGMTACCIFPQTALELNGVLNSCQKRSLFHHDLLFLLVPARVPLLVSLLLSSFFSQERGSVPSWCPGSSWFRLWCRCLSPFFSLLSFLRKWSLFHHGSGSGACLPSAFFLLFSGVISWFFGWGSGACLPYSLFFLFFGKGFCSIMMSWFLLVPARVQVLVSLLLSFFFSQEMVFCFLVPARVPVLVSLLLSSFFSQERGSVPSWFPGSFWFRFWFRCLSPFFLLSGRGFCSVLISWFLLVPAPVTVLMSLLLPSFHFLRKTVLFRHDCMVPFLLRLLAFLFRFHLWPMNFEMSNEWRQITIDMISEFWIAHDLLGSMDWCCLGSMLV